MERPGPDVDEALAAALAVLASAPRLALLRQLQTPKALREIELRTQGPGGGAGDPRERTISRQAVREHLDKLLELGVIVPREGQRDRGPAVEYALNHQKLFALSEEFRSLARLRPVAEPRAPTMQGPPPAAEEEARGPCLVMVKGLEEGRIFPLRPGPGRDAWVIGRRRGVDIALDFDPFVSGENTLVAWDGGAHVAADLPDSRNGTTVNFRPLAAGERRALRTGDVVGVGRCLLLYRA